jgi:hypothetical protein
MAVPRRKAVPSEQMQAITEVNSALQADNARLERKNAELKAERNLQEQKIKSLQITVIILVASSAGLGAGMGTSMLQADPGTALTLATTVFFAVITVSLGILNYMRR